MDNKDTLSIFVKGEKRVEIAGEEIFIDTEKDGLEKAKLLCSK